MSLINEYWRQYKWRIIKLTIVSISGLLVLLLFVPGVSQLLRDWREIKNRRSKVAEAQSWKEITGRLQDRNQLIEARLTAVYKEGPKEEVLSSIISLIQKKGRVSRVQFTSLRPHLPRHAARYQELSIEMGLRSNYHQLNEFLYLLESLPYITQVRYLKLSTNDMTSNEINTEMKISFFMATRDASAHIKSEPTK